MDVSVFLAENAKKVEKESFVVSDRFKDKHGKPVPWVLAPVSCTVDNNIKQKCTHGKNFEFNALTLKALEINGLSKPIDELIDDAKNA